MNSIIAAFGRMEAENLTPSDIDVVICSFRMVTCPCEPIQDVLSKAYQLAVKNGDLSNNPARLVDYRPENNRRIPYLLDSEKS